MFIIPNLANSKYVLIINFFWGFSHYLQFQHVLITNFSVDFKQHLWCVISICWLNPYWGYKKADDRSLLTIFSQENNFCHDFKTSPFDFCVRRHWSYRLVVSKAGGTNSFIVRPHTWLHAVLIILFDSICAQNLYRKSEN